MTRETIEETLILDDEEPVVNINLNDSDLQLQSESADKWRAAFKEKVEQFFKDSSQDKQYTQEEENALYERLMEYSNGFISLVLRTEETEHQKYFNLMIQLLNNPKDEITRQKAEQQEAALAYFLFWNHAFFTRLFQALAMTFVVLSLMPSLSAAFVLGIFGSVLLIEVALSVGIPFIVVPISVTVVLGILAGFFGICSLISLYLEKKSYQKDHSMNNLINWITGKQFSNSSFNHKEPIGTLTLFSHKKNNNNNDSSSENEESDEFYSSDDEVTLN